jgi:hypothetical protein
MDTTMGGPERDQTDLWKGKRSCRGINTLMQSDVKMANPLENIDTIYVALLVPWTISFHMRRSVAVT